MAAKVDITGQKFGRLTVLSEVRKRINGLIYWNCICDCGSPFLALGKTLRSGKTRSCGCLHLESSLNNLPDNKRPLGFKRTTSGGYLEVKTHRGFVREHVYIMECHLGRRLKRSECVHHIDENKQNNVISNLELMDFGEHTRSHHTGMKRSSETRVNISAGIRKSIKDRGSKGRKLNKDDVEAIRKKHAGGAKGFAETARSYGVTPPMIRAIVNFKAWRHIS